MPAKPNILIVGSINMDLAVKTAQMPLPGQTVLGDGFQTSPGGKGANQAVAAARLGGQCTMIGRVGQDAFGDKLLAGLMSEGINCAHVLRTAEATTGVAVVIVDSHGENSIVVASGANHRLTPDDVFGRQACFADAAAVLLQLELPLPTVRAAIEVARRNNCRVILDPAPAPRQMPPELYQVDILTPNDTEAEALIGATAVEQRVDKQVALDLIARGVKTAVLKLGPRGCLVAMDDGHFYRVPAYKVNVVDTTAAGDAFTGALAVAVAKGMHMHDASRFASAAGSLACTKFGVQSAMPTLAEVSELMESQPDQS